MERQRRNAEAQRRRGAKKQEEGWDVLSLLLFSPFCVSASLRLCVEMIRSRIGISDP
jgi:hypothetical protein